MSLLQTIKKDQVQSRKDRNRDKASLLTTLFSEAANVGLNDGKRESTDSEVLATIKKFLKNLEETIAAYEGTATALLAEKAWLTEYLPTQMDEDQLTNAVAIIVAGVEDPSPRSMGIVMKELKAQYDGQYDGKMASGIVKAALV
jgi:uncharacterized protein YqeY